MTRPQAWFCALCAVLVLNAVLVYRREHATSSEGSKDGGSTPALIKFALICCSRDDTGWHHTTDCGLYRPEDDFAPSGGSRD